MRVSDGVTDAISGRTTNGTALTGRLERMRAIAMRLVDIDALRKDFKVAERCDECPQRNRHCNADTMFARRDVCGMLDDAEIVDAIPLDWMKQRMDETSSGAGLNVELNNALFTVGVEWERWKKRHETD